jgi:hypothetical protein
MDYGGEEGCICARVVELVDTQVLEACGATRRGSSPRASTSFPL